MAQALTAQAQNQAIVANAPAGIDNSVIAREFLRLSPPVFTVTKTDEDPQHFLNELVKAFELMQVSDEDKVRLASHQLKEVADTWFKQWKECKDPEDAPINCTCFRGAFIDRFFPLEMREAKVEEFINLRQGHMTVKEYGLKFTQLSRYAPELVADSRARMSKYVTGINDLVKKECRTAMLIGDMNISLLMIYAQQMEKEKLKERERQNKRARFNQPAQSQQQSQGGGNRTQPLKFSIPAQSSSISPAPSIGNSDFQKGKVADTRSQGTVQSGTKTHPLCAKCGKNHPGRCLIGQDGCFKCGQPGHRIKECPMLNPGDQNRGKTQSTASTAPPCNPQQGATSGTRRRSAPKLVICYGVPQGPRGVA